MFFFSSHLPDIPSCPICLPNGSQTQATQEGDVYPNDGIILGNVLYVPQLTVNLISMACLIDVTKGYVLFSRHLCVLQGHNMRSPITLCKMQKGVYLYQPGTEVCIASVTESKSYDLLNR